MAACNKGASSDLSSYLTSLLSVAAVPIQINFSRNLASKCCCSVVGTKSQHYLTFMTIYIKGTTFNRILAGSKGYPLRNSRSIHIISNEVSKLGMFYHLEKIVGNIFEFPESLLRRQAGNQLNTTRVMIRIYRAFAELGSTKKSTGSSWPKVAFSSVHGICGRAQNSQWQVQFLLQLCRR